MRLFLFITLVLTLLVLQSNGKKMPLPVQEIIIDLELKNIDHSEIKEIYALFATQDNNIFDLQKPKITLENWSITAKQGQVELMRSSINKLRLQNEVSMKNASEAIYTNDLIFDQQQQIFYSDALCTIIRQNVVLKGQGMVFDLKTKHVSLGSNVTVIENP